MNTRKWFAALLSTIFLATLAAADSVYTAERKITQIADGVYVIRHRDSPDGNLNGNTTVIIGDKWVFVVDACFQLSAARQDVAQIRQWTNKPVRYLLITHFHNDHNMGTGVYRDAFPNIAIIAHRWTKEDMYRTPNTPSRFDQQIAIREQRLRDNESADGKPLTDSQRAEMAKTLVGKKMIREELKDFHYEAPNLTFNRELDLDLGNREVKILHLGRATTRGDTVAFLPKDRIVIAGDIVTHPILYTYDGFPSEWMKTLDSIAELQPQTIIPGHGDVLHDNRYLTLCRDFIASVVQQVHAHFQQLTKIIENPPLEDVRKGVDVSAFRERFAAESGGDNEDFEDAAAALVKITYNEERHNF